jgi:hypothetical protein
MQNSECDCSTRIEPIPAANSVERALASQPQAEKVAQASRLWADRASCLVHIFSAGKVHVAPTAKMAVLL